jgi:hypothetical protein
MVRKVSYEETGTSTATKTENKMRRPACLPKMDELIEGRVYYTRCRNLSYAVWNGHSGFIGIREKFGDNFLFTEYHWDFCEHHGTVGYAKDLGIDVPKDIKICERLGLWDSKTDRFIEQVKDADGESVKGPMGFWLYRYIDNGETLERDYRNDGIYWKGNDPLQKFLDKIAKDRSEDADDEIATQEIQAEWKKKERELEEEVENSNNIVLGEN